MIYITFGQIGRYFTMIKLIYYAKIQAKRVMWDSLSPEIYAH